MNIFQKFWAWLKGLFSVSPSVEEEVPENEPSAVIEEQEMPIEVPNKVKPVFCCRIFIIVYRLIRRAGCLITRQ